MKLDLTVLILTLNEETHIERCLKSVKDLAHSVIVIDSGSTDRTCDIAGQLGSAVYRNDWVNYATQLNWGLDNCNIRTTWVMRLDADEIVTPELTADLLERLPSMPNAVGGLTANRRIYFMGKWIKHGGIYPIRMLRIWRNGRGRCENRWMDEHIKVRGESEHLNGDLIDDNLNSLTWWTEKHNKYASREAIDLLNLRYRFAAQDSAANLRGSQAGLKRWVKENIYSRLPGGSRAIAYFLYRYIFKLGILDGKEGATFHFLQGFWYRYLVDAKVCEVERYMTVHQVDAVEAINRVLGINALAGKGADI